MRVALSVPKLVVGCLRVLEPRLSRAMSAAVEACARTRRLGLTPFGRSLLTRAKPKHAIKRMDRLLGDRTAWRARDGVYAALTRRLIKSRTRPVVLIDWTEVQGKHLVALSAALAVDGRAVVIRNETYGIRQLHSGAVQRRSLERIGQQLPEGVRPIVVVDAGFGVPFFRAVERLGWDYVGRLTQQMYLAKHGESTMQRVRSFFPAARPKPRSLGLCEVTAAHRFLAHVVLAREPNKGRHGAPRRTRKGTHPNAPAFKKCQARHSDPRALVSSLNASSARHIVHLYGLRMQIE